jgi:hypothetical protein
LQQLLVRLAIVGALLCGPGFLFVLWSGLSAIRADFGSLAFALACVACVVTIMGVAGLGDMQAERLHQRWLDQHGMPPPE